MLTDPNNVISAHILEKPKPADHVRQTVVRAREEIAKEKSRGGVQRHLDMAGEPLSFTDPWYEPPYPEWPHDVLPKPIEDMMFLRAMAQGVAPGALGLAILIAISGAYASSV